MVFKDLKYLKNYYYLIEAKLIRITILLWINEKIVCGVFILFRKRKNTVKKYDRFDRKRVFKQTEQKFINVLSVWIIFYEIFIIL